MSQPSLTENEALIGLAGQELANKYMLLILKEKFKDEVTCSAICSMYHFLRINRKEAMAKAEKINLIVRQKTGLEK